MNASLRPQRTGTSTDHGFPSGCRGCWERGLMTRLKGLWWRNRPALLAILTAVAMTLSAGVLALAVETGRRVVIADASPDLQNNTLTIRGVNFLAGATNGESDGALRVTLDLVELPILSASPNEIVASLPPAIAPASYLLTV